MALIVGSPETGCVCVCVCVCVLYIAMRVLVCAALHLHACAKNIRGGAFVYDDPSLCGCVAACKKAKPRMGMDAYVLLFIIKLSR